MLRSFITATCTPERASLLIKYVDLFDEVGYTTVIDALEGIIQADTLGQSDNLRSNLEEMLGRCVENIYRAHSISMNFADENISQILNHLRFILYFNTPAGYRPPYETEYDLYELGDNPKDILDAMFEESGYNVSSEPVNWINEVGVALLQKIIKIIRDKNKGQAVQEELDLLTGDALDTMKKFAVIFPESLAVTTIKENGGVIGDFNELVYRHGQRLISCSVRELAEELMGLVLISRTPAEVSKADYVRQIVEQVAGSGMRAMDVAKSVETVIVKVGLK